jgi:hypoxanthine phosphoribosyltransferase
MTRELANDYALPHTRIHLDALLASDVGWYTLVRRYARLLDHTVGLDATLSQAERWVREGAPFRLRKWRECDSILENRLAVEIGLRGFEPMRAADYHDSALPTVAIGLMYGGIELPIIAGAISDGLDTPLEWGFGQVSLYGNIAERKRAFSQLPDEYYSSLERRAADVRKSLCLEGGPLQPGQRVLILDDNCTTGRTLQLARDTLSLEGADVIGSIMVRYPSTNRYQQMLFPNHGCPDPDILLSFVRGLVSASPYTRLLREVSPTEGAEEKYLDVTGQFNKARARISRYLKKNGTPGADE